MEQKWCPRCKRNIPEPTGGDMHKVKKFFEDNKCYICDAPFQRINVSTSNTPKQTQTSPNSKKHLTEEKRKLLLAAVLFAIFEGQSAKIVSGILDTEDLSQSERVELLDLANSAAREQLKEKNVFQSGHTDGNGFLRWQKPKHLFCSDDLCPCTDKAHLKIGKSAYLFVNEGVVSLRRNYLTLLDLQVKLWEDAKRLDSTLIIGTGVQDAVMVCKIGAMKRGLDLATALQDAKDWYNNGLAPLRATPLTQKPYETEISKPWWKVW